MSEWQPIETAPKDGRSVIGFVPLPTMSVPYNYRILSLRFDDLKGRWLTDVHSFVPFNPSHWMPLPEPPK